MRYRGTDYSGYLVGLLFIYFIKPLNYNISFIKGHLMVASIDYFRLCSFLGNYKYSRYNI